LRLYRLETRLAAALCRWIGEDLNDTHLSGTDSGAVRVNTPAALLTAAVLL